ncbi:MBL fold metallo-hydrolase [Desulfosediminicola sp.]|uniref:MBL fold metallo-hydrolase n=1 Tax=Desulfosediminicola sp. TaxID=2886825 RepID=UPI003AF23E23
MLYARQHNFGPVQGFEVGIAPAGKLIKSAYVYQIDSFLIDTGPHHLRKKIGLMINSSAVASILLTHHHEDHSGNAAFLKSRTGAPVYLHPYGAAKVLKGFNILPYQHILFGKAQRFQAEFCPEVVEGEKITLKALHTPGHSKDHTVFHVEEEGWLFSGDLFVGEKIQFFRVDEKIDQQIASLRKIADLDFETLFCGHRPKMKNGLKLIRRKIDYLESFQQQVTDFYQKGLEEKEIIQQLRDKNDLPVRLFTMGNASFGHMVRSSLNTIPDYRQTR